MRKFMLALAALLVIPSLAGAGDLGSTYDWRSGNFYNSQKNLDGSTDVRGSNLRNGSTWTTTIEPNGDMSGRDSNFNSWKYDNSTGSYYNFGTGKMCVGKGAGRICN